MHLFKAISHVGEFSRVSVTFLRHVSGSISRGIKKPQSGKVSGKSNNKRKGAGTGIKNGRNVYIYIYILNIYIYIEIYAWCV